MEVPSCGIEAAMTEQDLNGPQIGAGFQQVGRKAGPQVDETAASSAAVTSGRLISEWPVMILSAFRL